MLELHRFLIFLNTILEFDQWNDVLQDSKNRNPFLLKLFFHKNGTTFEICPQVKLTFYLAFFRSLKSQCWQLVLDCLPLHLCNTWPEVFKPEVKLRLRPSYEALMRLTKKVLVLVLQPQAVYHSQLECT